MKEKNNKTSKETERKRERETEKKKESICTQTRKKKRYVVVDSKT
jgi:hypothetical protein